MDPSPTKHCIIGAGPAGLPIAKKLMELGEDFDVLEKNAGVGGLWYEQAHDTAVMISSKRISQYRDFPAPKSFPLFFTKLHAATYLRMYADAFGITPHIQFNTEVTRLRPAEDYQQTRHWEVTLANGEKRLYKTVALASGIYAKPKPLSYPGDCQIELMHSNEYKNPQQLRGKRILVIGNGNTACDIAVDALRVNPTVAISMYRGVYVFPPTFLGIPTGEWVERFVPFRLALLERWFARVGLYFSTGDLRPYGMPKPNYQVFNRHPVVNQPFVDQLKAGRLCIKPDIRQWDGHRVIFVDGSVAEYDLIVSAIGYQVHYPMLHPEDKILDWENGLPILFNRGVSPKHRGLFIAGMGQTRTGGWPMFEYAGYLMARGMAFEGASAIGLIHALYQLPYFPLLTWLTNHQHVRPATLRSYGTGELYRELDFIHQALNDLNCPNAPSRKVQAAIQKPWKTTPNQKVNA